MLFFKGDDREIVKLHWKYSKIFFWITEPISTKHCTQLLWVKRIQICSNEGLHPPLMEDYSEILKLYWKHLKIFLRWALWPMDSCFYLESNYYQSQTDVFETWIFSSIQNQWVNVIHLALVWKKHTSACFSTSLLYVKPTGFLSTYLFTKSINSMGCTHYVIIHLSMHTACTSVRNNMYLNIEVVKECLTNILLCSFPIYPCMCICNINSR